jgi:hypothetical protein
MTQTFLPGNHLDDQDGPVAIAVADLTEDGKLDLIDAGDGADGTIFLASEFGRYYFMPVSYYTAGGASSSLAVADLNGDGFPDLVIADYDNGVSVLLGNRAANFSGNPTGYAAGLDLSAVTVADVNGDGIPDLVVADLGGSVGDSDGGVDVLLGNWSGGFGPATAYAAGPNPVSVTVADLNGDGKPDLIVGDEAGGVDVLLADGLGGFGPATAYDTPSGYPGLLAVADLTGNGKLDLIVGNANGVDVLLGDGSGGFGPATPYDTGSGNPVSITVADVNGDGKPDLVAVEYDSVNVLLGDGLGGFGSPTIYGQNFFDDGGQFMPNAAAVADVFGDGRPALIVSGSDGVVVLPAANMVTVTAITATPSVPRPLDAGQGVVFMLAIAQAVTVAGSPVLTLDDGGSATYDPAASTTTSLVFDYTVAAGENTSDLTVTGLTLNGASVAVPATQSFQPAAAFGTGGDPTSVAVADVNGDGAPDLVVAQANGGVDVLLANGSGGFDPAVEYAMGSNLASVVVADLNGDGKPDLIAADQGGVDVLLGDGSGGFGAATSYAAGLNPVSVAVADLRRGDGSPDLIVADQGGGVDVLLSDGAGGFDAPTSYAAGLNPVSVTVADVDRDGAPDLIVADRTGGVDVLPGDGSGGFGTATSYAAGLSPVSATIADVNGDSRPDLVVADQNGGVSVLLNSSQQAGTFVAAGAATAAGASTGVVVDTTPPTVTADAASPATGDLDAGNTITLTLATSKPVIVTGAPTLTLNDGGSATYNAGASTATSLVFTTTVAAGQNAAALAVTGVNLPAGSSIQDYAGNDALLSGADATFAGLEVDTAAPIVSSPTLTVLDNAAATPIGITAPTDAGSSAGELLIAVASLPSDGTVLLSDGVTAVSDGEMLSLAQLTGLLFKPTADLSDLISAFTYMVTDPATNASTGTASLAIGPAPVVTGSVAMQRASASAMLDLFAGVIVSDAGAGQTETVTITQSDTANGVLTDPNAANDGYSFAGDVATLSGTAAEVTADLDALVFTPSAHQVAPGSMVTTGFILGITDSSGSTAVDAATSVVATAEEDPPMIGGTQAGQAITDQQTLSPFAAATITDPDYGAIETTTITLSNGGAGGTLTGAGLTPVGDGVYTLADGTPMTEQAELRALAFHPATGHVATGNTVTTEATLSVSDGMQTATDTTTTAAVTQAATGTAIGDVHMVTLDGLAYDFQADGDFTLERSTMAGNPFDVQIRTAPWAANSQASLTMQAAAKVGNSVVGFTAGDGVTINGITDTALDADHPVQVLAGGTLTALGGGEIQLDWAGGEGLTVLDEGFYLNLHVTVAAADGPGSVQGLLGSLSGQANDLALPDGTVLAQPVADAQLLGPFAEAWSVGAGSMLDGAGLDGGGLDGAGLDVDGLDGGGLDGGGSDGGGLDGGGAAITAVALGLPDPLSFLTATAPGEVLTGSLGETTSAGVVIQGSLATLAGGLFVNMGPRDTIDLSGAEITSADLHYAPSPTGGVLTITDGLATARLTTPGVSPTAMLTTMSDQHGGTLIRFA